MLHPRKTLPSARTRTARVFCDKGIGSRSMVASGVKKRVSATRLIPLSLVENYTRLRPLRQPQHVVHVVETGGLAGHEARGAHRSLGVGRAARGPVRDLDALPGAREVDRVVAHDIAAAGHREADAARLALAGHA